MKMVRFIYWNVKIESNTLAYCSMKQYPSNIICPMSELEIISRNNGVLANLRHFLTLSQMKQFYYSIIFPYISYAILARGSAYKTHINKVQAKQNHSIRLIFSARTFGGQTENTLPLLNLLVVLTVNNVYRLQALKFTHSWHKGLLPSLFHDFFFNTPVKYMDIIPDMHLDKIYTYQRRIPILVNKQLLTQRLFSGTISTLKISIPSTSRNI